VPAPRDKKSGGTLHTVDAPSRSTPILTRLIMVRDGGGNIRCCDICNSNSLDRQLIWCYGMHIA
jgi:hypothetical protein